MCLKVFFTLVSILPFALPACLSFPNVSIDEQIRLSIVGNPKHFVPSSVYTVHIESSAFTHFMLTCQASKDEGSFQILNNKKTTFAEDCLNTVIETNSEKKNRIEVLWTAPDSGCVNIKGAVRLKEGLWIGTNKTICELRGERVTNLEPVCCACDHAKYKIIFEGIWSLETHPKDFPPNLWLTHFSDLIGTVHSAKFSLWREGSIASYGFKQLAEFGVVRELETELRNQSTHLRSIIKASGLWYPNLNGNTTTVFRVDPRRHLLSLASMFGPSPDWIVGVSALNLCMSNCSWLEKDVLSLYPYDAGTDNGITYMSKNSPSDPPEKIRRITVMYPEDPRAPFYNPSAKNMEPLAKLYITREHVISKQCSDLTEEEILEQVGLTENTEEEDRAECAVSPYSSWSPCSVTCGKGLRMRTREYLLPDKSKMFKCDRQLVSKEMCAADTPLCPGDIDDEEVLTLAPPGECDVSSWSEWSDCSVTCGIGFILRTRTFIAEEGQIHKKCMHISTMEKQKCMLPSCTIKEPEISPACEVSEWSEWSPCSVTCGQGQRVRIRQFLSSKPSRFCTTLMQLRQIHSCANKKNCQIDLADAKYICTLEYDVGPCRGNFRKWTYDSSKHSCVQFNYGGCRGNRNRFNTLTECSAVCGSLYGIEDNTPINCVVSKWSQWSQCHPCINGTKTKTRTIVTHPKNNGRPCPILSKTINCSIPEEFCATNNNLI